MSEYKGYRDLIVYQKAYKLALEIFDLTKSFPADEKFSLVDQIRRSSRAVPSNIGAAWVKRKYPKSFVSKLLDALEEETETEIWLDLSKDHSYIVEKVYNRLIENYSEIARMLQSMFNNPEKFCPR